MGNTLNQARNTNQYFISVLSVGIVSVLCLLIREFVDYKIVGYLLLVAVSLLATSLRIKPVLLAAILSALVFNFLFIEPYNTLHIHSAEDVLLLLMFFVIALVNGVLTYKIRRAEQLAQERETKLNTMKLYNTLLDSLSHELRTPISTIMGAVGTLQGKSDRLSAQNEAKLLSEMEMASLRLNHQVENLLNMSRLESGVIRPKLDWCDTNELVYNVINNLKEELASRTLEVNKAPYLPLFRLDYGLTEQIVYNLLFNAIQYTPKEAAIEINLEYRPEVDFEPHEKVSYTFTITISDSGGGFPDNEIAQAFDKFYRVKHSKTGGTGLGLSIVKGFVEAQNGVVTLENKESGGAIFKVQFPAQVMHTKNISSD